MEFDEIKEMMKVMEEYGLSKLAIKRKDGSEIHLEKPLSAPFREPDVVYSRALPPPVMEVAPPIEDRSTITSPMVGTFYGSPSPDDPAFVKVGDHVREDTVVCIIEAMKVMNEVKAGARGTITKVLIDNGHPVEYGTELFEIQ